MTDTFFQYLIDWADEAGVRTVHFFNRDNPRAGGMTIAYMPHIMDELGFPRSQMAEVAVAYCKAGDTFCRHEGRMLAMDRLYNAQSIPMPIYKGGHPVRKLREIFCDTLDVADIY